MLKLPVLDVDGEKLGVVNDFGIATGEVFPHVTSLAFRGPGKTPFMISWRKWVDRIDETGVHLKTSATEIRFSYLQPTELLLARDVLNKQIVDTQGMKVVRVNDIKFSMSGENQLRLLGAEVGARGLLRAISPALEHIVEGFMKHLGKPLSEDIIAWSYMDLLDRSTKNIQLSVSHKTLGELHPADIADIIEQLDPRLRAQVFAQLDTAQAAEAISEFDDDELMTEMLEGLSDTDASSMLAMMDPDDAADLIDELDYEKAEKLLRLMGVKEEKAIRNLLGYEDNTAGRIMTSEFVSLPATATVGDAIEAIRKLDKKNFALMSALYLLTAEHKLWMQIRNYVERNEIKFERFKPKDSTENGYTLLCCAKDLYLGTKHITISDLADTELIAPKMFALICNAMAIRRFGLGAIQYKERTAQK